MPKMGDNVTPTQERKRGNGNKPQQKYLPLPKMWLMGVNEGKKQELERIIKLLQDHKEPDMQFHKFETLVNIDRIIELIKREKA